MSDEVKDYTYLELVIWEDGWLDDAFGLADYLREQADLVEEAVEEIRMDLEFEDIVDNEKGGTDNE